MTNNDVLRRIRYALDISDPAMIEIFKLYDHEIDQAGLVGLLKKEDETDYVACSDAVMGLFLDGLILYRRGGQKIARDTGSNSDSPLTNNDILKKIRIALELKEDDMLRILELAEIRISKSELSALFRKRDIRTIGNAATSFSEIFSMGLPNIIGVEEQLKNPEVILLMCSWIYRLQTLPGKIRNRMPRMLLHFFHHV